MREKYNQLCAQIGLGTKQAEGYWSQLTQSEKEQIDATGNPITMRQIIKNVGLRMRDGKATSDDTETTGEIDAT